MSTFGDSQVRNLFIADIAQTAPVTTIGAVTDGKIGVITADDGSYKIAMSKGGTVYTSASIEPSKELSKATKKLVISNKVTTVEFTGTPVVGESVEVVVYLDSYGAHNTTDAVALRGGWKVQTATRSETVAGIAQTLQLAIDATAITGLAAVASGDDVIITFSRSDFKLGKFDGKVNQGRVLVKTFESGVTGSSTDAYGAIDNGVEIANLEWFTEGNRGDVYRGVGFPNNFDALYVADSTEDYTLYETAFYSERISAPGDKQRQMITVAGSKVLCNAIATITGGKVLA